MNIDPSVVVVACPIIVAVIGIVWIAHVMGKRR